MSGSHEVSLHRNNVGSKFEPWTVTWQRVHSPLVWKPKRECGAALSDPKKAAVADIRNAAAGAPSPKNAGGVLQSARGIEIGHVFKLGSIYAKALDAIFLDDKGERHPMIMGC